MKSIRLIGLSAVFVLMAGMVSCDDEVAEFYEPTDEEKLGGIFEKIAKDEMVFVEGGTFFMGATAEQVVDAFDDEKPEHEVTLDDFYIGKFEVTQALWQHVMGGNAWSGYDKPSATYGLGDYYPVYYVSYDDVVKEFLPNRSHRNLHHVNALILNQY